MQGEDSAGGGSANVVSPNGSLKVVPGKVKANGEPKVFKMDVVNAKQNSGNEKVYHALTNTYLNEIKGYSLVVAAMVSQAINAIIASDTG